MAGINDYSNTAGSNTTINGIDISEGCSPAGINNAIRQLMADIANMDDGVVPLQTPDINGGTIDGAALGASSPITSAVISGDLTVDTDTLYVDSTNNRVGIGTSSPSASLTVDTDLSVTSSNGNNLIFKGSSGTSTGGIDFQNNTASVATIGVAGGSGKITFDSDPSNTFADSLIRFDVDGSEAMRIESDGKVGIGTTTPSVPLHINSGTTNQVAKFESTDNNAYIAFADDSTTELTYIGAQGDALTAGVGFEAMRIDSNGRVGINQTSPSWILTVGEGGNDGTSDEDGYGFNGNGQAVWQTSSANQFFLNDSSSSAATHNYILFRYNGSTIGDIDTQNNALIRYNTFTGGHWSQFHDGTNPELKKGTVMSLTGDKLEYSKCEKTITQEDGTEKLQKFEIAGTHEIGSEVTVPNDEYGEEDSTTTATVVSNYTADHLVKVKVSDSIADKAVYGVWAGKYNDGDLSVEALGTSTIRIKQGEVLEVGDLLESAGDGTAQKQTDDTIKNSTIAKVTSPTVIETFDDNSFLVSCVLYCG